MASMSEAKPALSENEAKALALKEEGNKALSESHYTQAVEKYSDAIAIAPSSILYSNRSMAYIKLEQYGLAILDADASIEADPSYIKGYYRRGSASFALGKTKAARKDFKTVVSLRPSDKDAVAKLAACDKAIKEAAFAAAIESEDSLPLSQTYDPSAQFILPAYTGPHPYDAAGPKPDADAEKALFEAGNLPRDFVLQCVEAMKAQKALHKRYVARVLIAAKSYFDSCPTLTEIEAPAKEGEEGTPGKAKFNRITVCGDTHGQFYDVLNIFEQNGFPSETNPYLFNGDFVDRGSFSVEVILTYLLFKLSCPSCIHLSRGNHETKNMNKIYGFEGEVKNKFDSQIFSLFLEVFCALPLAATIGGKVFVVHGGLSVDEKVTLDDVRAIRRGIEPPEGGLFSDLLWSDPQPFPGKSPSKRGVGFSFGPDITASFLKRNGLELLVRSHEVKDEGYLVEHAGKCITIFSAPNYCDQMGNKGAFIHFDSTLVPVFTQFSSVPHPDIRPMAYAQGMGGLMGL